MIKLLLISNKQGQIRLMKCFESCKKQNTLPCNEIKDLIRKCLIRTDKQCAFFDNGDDHIIYRKYATLYFIMVVDSDENELASLEFLHNVVEALDRYFNRVCELDILFSIDRVHMILDEMLQNGCIVESNKTKILAPIQIMDQVCISK